MRMQDSSSPAYYNTYLISSDQLPLPNGTCRIKSISDSANTISKFFSANNSTINWIKAPFSKYSISEETLEIKPIDYCSIHILGGLLIQDGNLYLPCYKEGVIDLDNKVDLVQLIEGILKNYAGGSIILDTFYFDENGQSFNKEESISLLKRLCQKFSDISVLIHAPENSLQTYFLNKHTTRLTNVLIDTLTLKEAREFNVNDWFNNVCKNLLGEPDYSLPIFQKGNHVPIFKAKNAKVEAESVTYKINETQNTSFSLNELGKNTELELESAKALIFEEKNEKKTIKANLHSRIVKSDETQELFIKKGQSQEQNDKILKEKEAFKKSIDDKEKIIDGLNENREVLTVQIEQFENKLAWLTEKEKLQSKSFNALKKEKSQLVQDFEAFKREATEKERHISNEKIKLETALNQQKHLLEEEKEKSKKLLEEKQKELENNLDKYKLVLKKIISQFEKERKVPNNKKEKYLENSLKKVQGELNNTKKELQQTLHKAEKLEQDYNECLVSQKELLVQVVSLKAQLANTKNKADKDLVTKSIEDEETIWAKTVSIGTEKAFSNYLKTFTNGIYKDEANMHLDTLKNLSHAVETHQQLIQDEKLSVSSNSQSSYTYTQ